MRYNVVLRYIGIVLLLNAVFLFISAGISFFNGMDTAFYPLLLSAVLTSALGAFPMIFVGKSTQINMKEGYAIVVGAWLMACLIGTFPYLLWGGEFDAASAWFESVSGFTTTGATALDDVEALPRGLIFWRSATHWLGGIGVVMFVLIIMPVLGKTKMTLSSVELSPLARENYKYKAQKIVQILLTLYICMTVAETILLKIAGMGWFDALNHAFSTVASGGFSTKNLSVGAFDNPWIEVVLMVFMLLSGVHFGLIYATVTGKKNNMFRSEVTRFYMFTALAAGVLISLNLLLTKVYPNIWDAMRYGFFQAIATITTTGFATADTNLWSSFTTIILIYLMFQCACAGSTTGGIKSDRIWLAIKVIKARILQQQHPRAIIKIKMNGTTQDEALVSSAMFYIVIYFLVISVGTIIVTATGLDLMDSFSMTASCMGNVGPGFGEVGSMGNYANLSPFVQVFCTLFMLLGRLEIFGLIQLFLIKWWK